jgi:hypothetical protein
MAQVKPASAQVWKRNRDLVRSVLAIVYIANLKKKMGQSHTA